MMPLLHLLWLPVIVMSLEAPVIDKEDTAILTSIDGDLDIILTCKGKHNITWSSPHHTHINKESDYGNHEEEYDYPDYEEEYVTKTWEYRKDSDWPFLSILKISQSHGADTGLYQCRYDNWPNVYDSTFLYVYDNVTVVSGPQQYVSGYIGESFTLPCFPTKPGIILNLYKNNHQGDQVDITQQFTWVGTSGFISKQNASVHDNGDYYCGAQGIEEKFHIYVTIHKKSQSVTAVLNHCVTREYVIGQNFTLNCHVSADGVDHFKWKFPNTNVNYEKGILSVSKDLGTSQDVTVLASSSDDTGVYECQPKGFTITSEPTKVQLQILDPCVTKPYIKLHNRWLNNLHIMEGDDIRWITELRTFPNNPIITYRNNQGRIIFNYTKDNCEVDEIFNLRNITAEDFGKYILEVKLNKIKCRKQIVQQGIRNTTQIYIQVKSPPQVLNILAPPVTAPTEGLATIVASCTVRGFPEPTVKWSFQELCQNNRESCKNFAEIKVSPEALITKKVLPPGNLWEVNISFATELDGTLRCSANNDLGRDNLDVVVNTKASTQEPQPQAENRCSLLKMCFGIILLIIPARLL